MSQLAATASSKSTLPPQAVTNPQQNSVLTHSVSQEAIAQRAFEKFLERGSSHGRDQEDWLAAEMELRSKGEHLQKPSRIQSA